MAKFTKLSFCQKLIFWHQTFTQMFNVSIVCMKSIRLFQQKLWYKLKSLQNALRITKGNNSNRISPYPFYSNINVHLVDINMFAKFEEIPSMPVQDIKEKPKCCGQRITKGNNS